MFATIDAFVMWLAKQPSVLFWVGYIGAMVFMAFSMRSCRLAVTIMTRTKTLTTTKKAAITGGGFNLHGVVLDN